MGPDDDLKWILHGFPESADMTPSDVWLSNVRMNGTEQRALASTHSANNSTHANPNGLTIMDIPL
jgi:hypothetical protein